MPKSVACIRYLLYIALMGLCLLPGQLLAVQGWAVSSSNA